jgi:hypothetical protein
MVVPVYQSAHHHIQEDSHLHEQYHENHRSHNLPYDVAPFAVVYWLLRTNRYIFCIHLFIVCSVLWQVHSFFHSEFSREGDLELPVSNFSILSFSLRSSNSCWHFIHLIPSIFSSVTWSRRHFLCQMWPIQLAFLHFVLHWLFLHPWLMCNTSFFVWLVELIFIHLQHHTKLCCRCGISLIFSLNVSPIFTASVLLYTVN